MRIRKRKVSLPLSSLLPVTLSDLHSNQSPTTTAPYLYGQDLDGVSALDNGDGGDVDMRKSCTVASGSKNVHSQGESDSSTQVVEKSENIVTLRKRRCYTSFEEEEEEEADKGKKMSNVLEEGSRCRRANGKGWRCCQKTFYGHSLCEHHLKSINKSFGGGLKKKKRVKLGMVKARSISSLLGQTSTSSANADAVVPTESEISAPADQFAAYDKNDHGANELETGPRETDTDDQTKQNDHGANELETISGETDTEDQTKKDDHATKELEMEPCETDTEIISGEIDTRDQLNKNDLAVNEQEIILVETDTEIISVDTDTEIISGETDVEIISGETDAEVISVETDTGDQINKMSAKTNLDLKFPMRLFSLGCEPKLIRSINYNSKISFLEKVEFAVGAQVWNHILKSPLGVIARFVGNRFKWSSKVVETLLLKQLVCEKDYEIWCLFVNTPARFSLSEFENITGLNCGAPPPGDDKEREDDDVHKELWRKMGVKESENPSRNDLRNVVEDVATWEEENDKIRFAYLSILATVIFSNDARKQLCHRARMVMDLPKFEGYPWGRLGFKTLIRSVKSAALEKEAITINGFVQVLQIWMYTLSPTLGVEFGNLSGTRRSPPLLKFNGQKWYGKRNMDIDKILADDEENIKKVSINKSVPPPVWNHEGKDEKIDALVRAICKEGGLGDVTWVEHGLKSFIKKSTDGGDCEAMTEEEGQGDCGEKTRKRKRGAMAEEEGQGDGEVKRRKKKSKEYLGWSSKREYKKYKRVLSMVENLKQEVKIVKVAIERVERSLNQVELRRRRRRKVSK